MVFGGWASILGKDWLPSFQRRSAFTSLEMQDVVTFVCQMALFFVSLCNIIMQHAYLYQFMALEILEEEAAQATAVDFMSAGATWVQVLVDRALFRVPSASAPRFFFRTIRRALLE